MLTEIIIYAQQMIKYVTKTSVIVLLYSTISLIASYLNYMFLMNVFNILREMLWNNNIYKKGDNS